MFASTYTTQGVREQNEDTIYPAPDEVAGELFIVADGLGGHADGRVASELACRALRQILEQEDPASFVLGGHRLAEAELQLAFLSDAVRQVGATVWHEAKQCGSDMGTTLLAVLIKKGRGYCAHVGDCALYVSESGEMPPTKLTSEHRRGASLIRSLGAQEQVTPDLFSFAFGDGAVLVMGCDGFWERVPVARIGELLGERPPFAVAEALAQEALAAGSQDNVSVIVVEGEGFVARHVAGQVAAYAAVLEAADDDPASTTKRQALLGFVADHAPRLASPAPLLAQLLRRLPDAAQAWAGLRGRLPADLQTEVTRLAGRVALSAGEAEALIHAREGRHDGRAALAYEQYLAVHPDDAALRLHYALSLLEAHDSRQAAAELERAVALDPGLREQAAQALAAHLQAPEAGSLRPGDDELYERYLALAPADEKMRYSLGVRLWRSGERRRGWAELRRLYGTSARWRELILGFLREHGSSLDAQMLREYVEAALAVGGPGVIWALEELVRRDPAARTYAEGCATSVARGWPVPGESEAAQRWLAGPAAQPAPRPETGGRERELLEQIEQLAKARAHLQERLEEANGLLRQQQEEIANLKAYLEKSKDLAYTYQQGVEGLGRNLLDLWSSFPRECEQVLTREVLLKWEEWLRQLKVYRRVGDDEQAGEGKKPRGLFRR